MIGSHAMKLAINIFIFTQKRKMPSVLLWIIYMHMIPTDECETQKSAIKFKFYLDRFFHADKHVSHAVFEK